MGEAMAEDLTMLPGLTERQREIMQGHIEESGLCRLCDCQWPCHVAELLRDLSANAARTRRMAALEELYAADMALAAANEALRKEVTLEHDKAKASAASQVRTALAKMRESEEPTK